jgi:hypothetical protein
MTESAKEKLDAFTPSKVGQIGMVVRNARSSAEYFSRRTT